MSKRKLNNSNLYSNSSPSPSPLLCDIPYSNASPSGGTLAKCQNRKKADYWTDENSIGINLGSWLCMETWIFDTPYFKPCYGFNHDNTDRGTCAGKIPDGTTENYQRGELATIREINQVVASKLSFPLPDGIDSFPSNPGEVNQTWTMFKDNIPPIGRIEPDANAPTQYNIDGAINLMQMFWSTFLTKNDNIKYD